MPDEHSPAGSWLKRITETFSSEPRDLEDLNEVLMHAKERGIIDPDAFEMLEGVLQVVELQVRDIMVPRAQMDVVDINDPAESIARYVVAATHSRFPVIGKNRDDIIGILLAKDLLRYFATDDFDLHERLRPAIFVPEAKRLNVLLREFRASHNHMAIVVDEYGGVAGLVTIEDVLEQIVGDIDDEFDFDETADNILRDNTGRYRVKAITEIADFNAAFHTELPLEDADTIGGLMMQRLGRLPKRGEVIELERLRIQVLRADSRRLYTLLVDPQQRMPLDE